MEASANQSSKDEVSFLRGNRYVFSYQHNRIEFWASSFTGKEVVKVNGKVVSEARSYRKRVQHRLSIGGQPLVLEWRIDSLLKGPIFCTLYTEDRAGQLQPHARKQMRFWTDLASEQPEQEKVKPSWSKRLLGLGEVVLFGLVGFWLSRNNGFWSLDFWLILLAIAMVVGFIKNRFTNSSRNASSSKDQSLPLAVIEDVPLTSESDDAANLR